MHCRRLFDRRLTSGSLRVIRPFSLGRPRRLSSTAGHHGARCKGLPLPWPPGALHSRSGQGLATPTPPQMTSDLRVWPTRSTNQLWSWQVPCRLSWGALPSFGLGSEWPDPCFKPRLSGVLATFACLRQDTVLLDTGALHGFICARMALMSAAIRSCRAAFGDDGRCGRRTAGTGPISAESADLSGPRGRVQQVAFDCRQRT